MSASFEQLKESARGMTRFAALGKFTAATIPCGVFFVNSAPPRFTCILLLTMGLVPPIFVLSQRIAPPKPKIPYRTVHAMLLTIVLWLIYTTVLEFVTVKPPADFAGGRTQIGFSLCRWSLTDDACAFLDRVNSDEYREVKIDTADAMMLAWGAWSDRNKTYVIWKRWTVVAAEATLSVIFLVTIGLWTYACSIMGKYLQSTERMVNSQPTAPPNG